MPPPANIDELPLMVHPRNVGDESTDCTPPPTPALFAVPATLPRILHAVKTGFEPSCINTPPARLDATLLRIVHRVNEAFETRRKPPAPALAAPSSKTQSMREGDDSWMKKPPPTVAELPCRNV